jgi:hypothetical protein
VTCRFQHGLATPARSRCGEVAQGMELTTSPQENGADNRLVQRLSQRFTALRHP